MNYLELNQLLQKLIPPDIFGFLEQEFPSSPWVKFRDVSINIHRNIDYFLALNLPTTSLSVLDIGTAYGYFPFLLKQLGHSAIGYDVSSPELSLVWSLIKTPCRSYEIKPFVPLFPSHSSISPSLDLITMMGVNFSTNGSFWGWPEYIFLYQDCLSSLILGGIVHITVNWGRETDFILDSKELSNQLGPNVDVKVSNNTIILTRTA